MAHTNIQIHVQYVEEILVPTESKDYRNTAQMQKVERVREERINITEPDKVKAFHKAVKALAVLGDSEE